MKHHAQSSSPVVWLRLSARLAEAAPPPGGMGVFCSLSLDPRSLALFRVVFGCTLLFGDLLPNLPFALTFYGDRGVLPRATLLEHHAPAWYWSVYCVSGADAFVAGVSALYAAALLALVLGWRTREATACAFVLCVSQHSRNYMLATAFDLLAAAVLFWSISLPLGAVGSVDAARSDLARLRCARRSPRAENCSWAASAAPLAGALGLRLQIWIMCECAPFRPHGVRGACWHHL
jgi:hypothetical protein